MVEPACFAYLYSIWQAFIIYFDPTAYEILKRLNIITEACGLKAFTVASVEQIREISFGKIYNVFITKTLVC